MKATEFIKNALDMSKDWVVGLVTDMKDAPTTFPTPKGGNHPLWVLGHLTFSEAHLVGEYIQGDANPLAHWQDIFGQGSEPVADASRYPSFDEVLTKFQQTRAHTLKVLASLTDADLDKPSRAPEEMRQYFGTVGACFAVVILHFTYHGGQVADSRRAAGRKPLMG
jgi:hypothetical protein